MSHHRLSASRVAHKSTGGTLQSLPEPVDPVANASDCLTSQTVAPPVSLQFSGFFSSLREKRPFGPESRTPVPPENCSGRDQKSLAAHRVQHLQEQRAQ